jgi:maltose 6'-phosphate phosphatase
MEEDQFRKITQLAGFIDEQNFDIIALQEVNQSLSERPVSLMDLAHFHRIDGNSVIKADNYAYVLHKQLGIKYHWTYIQVHLGFGIYDEGLAILSRTPILDAFTAYVSDIRDYNNYRTRKVLTIKTAVSGQEAWFINGHFGWWDDEEPFKAQWDRSLDLFKRIGDQTVFIMGDFNNASHRKGEGYDYVTRSGWHDCYVMAAERDEGFTVVKPIAGWENSTENLRIDYVFSNRRLPVQSARVMLDGKHGPVVSDHFGLAVQLKY